MQLAVDVSIPEVFGGLGGEAIYIGASSEGSDGSGRTVQVWIQLCHIEHTVWQWFLTYSNWDILKQCRGTLFVAYII